MGIDLDSLVQTAISIFRSSWDKDPWGQVSSVSMTCPYSSYTTPNPIHHPRRNFHASFIYCDFNLDGTVESSIL
jgi:hypothetical protein